MWIHAHCGTYFQRQNNNDDNDDDDNVLGAKSEYSFSSKINKLRNKFICITLIDILLYAVFFFFLTKTGMILSIVLIKTVKLSFSNLPS